MCKRIPLSLSKRKDDLPMKKGVAVWNYPGPGIENAREFIRRGFDAVSWLGSTFAGMTEQEDEELISFLRETKAAFTVHYGLPNPEKPDVVASYRTAIERCAAWQQKYGLMEGLTFDFWYDPELSMPNLAYAIETMRGLDTFLACEDTPLNDRMAEKFLRLLKPEDHYGILLDLGHMNIRQHSIELSEPEDFSMAIQSVPFKVFEVHLHNNKGRKDEHMYISYGNLPLEGCIDGLRKKRFDGIVTVEVVQRDWTREEGFAFAEQTRDAFFSKWDTL